MQLNHIFDIHILRVITKPVPLLILLLLAGRAQDRNLPLIAAFIFSLLGDITLELPNYLPFALGLGFFLIAHLFYIRCFWTLASKFIFWPLIPISIYCGSVYTYMLPGLGPLTYPVALYVCVIGLMMWRAFVYRIVTQKNIALYGALLFALSDSLIGIDRFVFHFEGARYMIILSYWGAQYMLFSLQDTPHST